ncbi:MAG TPA: sigma 54-interacting transcriptional regulator [Clostridia bacterium]|nr:sigma 54-interacting transcriptional regulator [Clostridia bacterium]
MSTALVSCGTQTHGILVASSNEFLRRRIIETLKTRRLPAQEALGGADALGKLETTRCRLLLLDHHLADLNATDVVDVIEAKYPWTEVVLLDPDTGRFLLPPNAGDSPRMYEIFSALQSADGHVHTCASSRSAERIAKMVEPLTGMVGTSEAMQHLSRLVRLVAERNTTVLLTGETGTGKELVAQGIHELSGRAQRPIVTVNCAAIPEALLEAELFGYTRGAFTGAVQSRVGRIHAAQGGTLFLDEIGELPLGLQAKLLRFLEEGEVQRLGSSDVFRVAVRVVAATNVQVEQRVAEKQFREDLYYRLAVFPIEIPPLRERGNDVLTIAEHFLRKFATTRATLSEDARQMLTRHAWPGNVRELKHVMERASILAGDAEEITTEHITIRGMGARDRSRRVN